MKRKSNGLLIVYRKTKGLAFIKSSNWPAVQQDIKIYDENLIVPTDNSLDVGNPYINPCWGIPGNRRMD